MIGVGGGSVNQQANEGNCGYPDVDIEQGYSCRVDMLGLVGAIACGECAGGHHVHGIGKVQTAGYIAGLYAAQA